MTPITIKLSEITILPQPRREFHDLDALAADIHEHGLLQPPTVTTDKRLLYGERRVRACKLLDLQEIQVLVCEETLTNSQILERQIAENVARDDLSWQERALALLDLWRIKRQESALEGWEWGQREASALFKISVGTANYVLRVAKKLEGELKLPEDKRKYWHYTNAAEAWRMGILAEEQDRLAAELARRTREATNAQPVLIANPLSSSIIEPHSEITFEIPDSISFTEEAKKKYESNPLNTVPYEQYVQERNEELKQRQAERDNTVYISRILYHGDSIEFMSRDENANRFDHIITDIPYGIDMEMLNQNNVHGGIQDIDRVEDTHDVKSNEDLHASFFPAAFKCTKESSYVVTFCDIMQWQRMYDLAVAAGFSVQRWPLIWRKINQSVMNNCAGFNTTKDYEIVLLCRKPSSVLVAKTNTSIFDGGNTVAVKETGHPFAKPYEVTRKIIEAVSSKGQLILDPFAGGGSIALEILRSERNVIACELETHHFNLMMENLKREFYLKVNPKYIFK